MWGIIKKAVNSNLSKPLDSVIVDVNGEVISGVSSREQGSRDSLISLDGKSLTIQSRAEDGVSRVGSNGDTGNGPTLFGKIRGPHDHLTSVLSSTRASRIDKLDTLETRLGTVNPTAGGTDTLLKYARRVEETFNGKSALQERLAYSTTVRNTLLGSTPYVHTHPESSGARYRLIGRFFLPWEGLLRMSIQYRIVQSSHGSNYCRILWYCPFRTGDGSYVRDVLGYVVNMSSVGSVTTSQPTSFSTAGAKYDTAWSTHTPIVYTPAGVPFECWLHTNRISSDPVANILQAEVRNLT